MVKNIKKAKKLNIDRISDQPIFDIDVEKAVLNCLLYDSKLSNYIYRLSEEDFYSLDNRKMFKLFRKIIDKKYTLDPVFIPSEYRTPELIDVLTYDAVTIRNWEYYFKRLKELSNLRKIQDICYQATIQTQERKSITSIKNYLITEATSIKEQKDNDETEMVDEQFTKIVEDESLISVKTGFPKLDRYCKGFLKSSFNVIASYPRAGKSTFVLNMIDHICRVQNKSVLFVSLEMDYVELHAKLVSLLSGISFEELIFGEPESKNWQKINNARAKIADWRLYRMGEEDTTPADIEMKLKEVKADVVFIDYLQLMNANIMGNTFRENVTNLSRELKQVARRTKVPIVAVSAINRSYASREDKRPRLSDLRETSQIEFDAGLVLMLHRESLFRDAGEDEDSEEFEKKASLIIAKNRFGKDNIEIDYFFDGSLGKFEEVTHKYRKERRWWNGE